MAAVQDSSLECSVLHTSKIPPTPESMDSFEPDPLFILPLAGGRLVHGVLLGEIELWANPQDDLTAPPPATSAAPPVLRSPSSPVGPDPRRTPMVQPSTELLGRRAEVVALDRRLLNTTATRPVPPLQSSTTTTPPLAPSSRSAALSSEPWSSVAPPTAPVFAPPTGTRPSRAQKKARQRLCHKGAH